MTTEEIIEIAKCGETTTVQFKQEFTSQKDIAKDMVAFANTRGGKIFFGIKDKTGDLIGLSYEDIQTISRELGNTANEQVRPTIYIDTEVVRADDKRFLVCSIANGRNKPYKTLTGEIWVKQGADKRRVTENSEILALFQESGAYKPELQAVNGSSISDLEMTTVNEYFEKNFGREKESFGMPVENLLQSQNILTAENELTVAGAMFFARNPQRFMPALVIKAVAYYGNDIAGSEYRDSRDISGTIPWMFREAMSFAKSNLHHRQNGQNFNKTGILEIPEVVLEELIQNSLVHLDLIQPAAIRLLIFDDRVEIINAGCLYGGLEVSDILLGVTKQRNPAMAALSGRTMIYRGLGSGILRAIKEGVKVEFTNNEKTNEFKAIIWKHSQNDITNKAISTASDADVDFTETLQKLYRNFTETLQGKHYDILKLVNENNWITTTEMATKLGVSRQTVANRIRFLQEHQFLKRIGGDKGGYWQICIPETN